MADFSTVLSNVASAGPAAPEAHARVAGVEGALTGLAATKARSRSGAASRNPAASAYADIERQAEADARTASAPRSAPSRERQMEARQMEARQMEALMAELRRAEGSIEALRRLRRRIAWACHPDRARLSGDPRAETLMAELNARIDAAIREAARRAGFRRT